MIDQDSKVFLSDFKLDRLPCNFWNSARDIIYKSLIWVRSYCLKTEQYYHSRAWNNDKDPISSERGY